MTQEHVLAGITVISMAEQFPGPFATMLLADMGAKVVIVERPDIGDPSRFLPPFFEALNHNKRSVALDVKRDDDKQKLISLVESADIFLEGFRPGKLENIGLGYLELSARNPRLIYASITGYGQTGPYRNRAGHDISYQGVSGALYEGLNAGAVELPSNLLLGDVSSALYATIGVLAALEARHRTGVGTYIDVAMSDTVTSFMTAQLGMALNGGQDLPGPAAEPGYDLFETSDQKWITISVAHEDEFWRRLCDAVELPEFSNTSRRERVNQRGRLNAAIRSKIGQKPYSYWDEVFTQTDQMFGPAYDRRDVINDRHAVARGLFETLKHSCGREQIILRQPIKFQGYANVSLVPSPSIGEHNQEIFGHSDAV